MGGGLGGADVRACTHTLTHTLPSSRDRSVETSHRRLTGLPMDSMLMPLHTANLILPFRNTRAGRRLLGRRGHPLVEVMEALPADWRFVDNLIDRVDARGGVSDSRLALRAGDVHYEGAEGSCADSANAHSHTHTRALAERPRGRGRSDERPLVDMTSLMSRYRSVDEST